MKADDLFELFGGSKSERARKSYSLPVDLIEAVREQARAYETSESAIVEKCLRKILSD